MGRGRAAAPIYATALPSLSLEVLLILGEAWRSPTEIPPPPPPRRRATGGLELLLHHRSLHTGGEGVIKSYVCGTRRCRPYGTWIRVRGTDHDWIAKMFDYINRVS